MYLESQKQFLKFWWRIWSLII